MRAWSKKGTQSISLTLNDGDEVGDGGEGTQGGCPLAKTLGDRAHHLLQPVDVRLLSGSYKYSSGIIDEASSSRRGEKMDRQVDR